MGVGGADGGVRWGGEEASLEGWAWSAVEVQGSVWSGEVFPSLCQLCVFMLDFSVFVTHCFDYTVVVYPRSHSDFFFPSCCTLCFVAGFG